MHGTLAVMDAPFQTVNSDKFPQLMSWLRYGRKLDKSKRTDTEERPIVPLARLRPGEEDVGLAEGKAKSGRLSVLNLKSTESEVSEAVAHVRDTYADETFYTLSRKLYDTYKIGDLKGFNGPQSDHYPVNASVLMDTTTGALSEVFYRLTKFLDENGGDVNVPSLWDLTLSEAEAIIKPHILFITSPNPTYVDGDDESKATINRAAGFRDLGFIKRSLLGSMSKARSEGDEDFGENMRPELVKALEKFGDNPLSIYLSANADSPHIEGQELDEINGLLRLHEEAEHIWTTLRGVYLNLLRINKRRTDNLPSK